MCSIELKTALLFSLTCSDSPIAPLIFFFNDTLKDQHVQKIHLNKEPDFLLM